MRESNAKAKWGVTMTLIGLVALSATGCFSAPEDEPSGVSSDALGTRTRVAVRGMMGLDPTAPSDPTRQEERLEASARYILAELQRREPGALDRFDAELARKNEASVQAWARMRDRLNEIAESEQVRQAIARDPLFDGAAADLDDGGGDDAENVPNANGDLEPAESDDSGEGSIGTKGFAGGLKILTGGSDAASGIPNLGRGSNGRYGDDRTGASGAARDAADLLVFGTLSTLNRIDNGGYTPDRESRLGAYAATRSYPRGSVGFAVHRAIGSIYVALGNLGQEKIGRVFNDPQARALYQRPVTSGAGYRIAQIEHRYWVNVKNEDGWSPGGNLGAAFSPAARYAIQIAVSAP